MPVSIQAIANCDDAVLFWSIEQKLEDCLGFAIEREQKLANGQVQRVTLPNYTGFAKDDPKSDEHRPSNVWPFQRFSWSDHSVNLGDTVRYRVVPMIHTGGQLQQQLDERSEWTGWITLTGDAGDTMSSYFNRGLVLSQFMGRYLEDLRVKEGLATIDDALKSFKKSLDVHDEPIRLFLAGALRVEMLQLLKTAKEKGQHVYGALFELDDEELVESLKKLGARAHLVLANGSVQKKKGESPATARKRDENADARQELEHAGVEVHGRFVSPGALAHNKFMVLTDASKTPLAAWTGSTNWTKTGLCTQINNGLLVSDHDFAQRYLDQWQLLLKSGSDFPPDLVTSNTGPKLVAVGQSQNTIWFSRTHGGVDLAAIDACINGAKQAILFLMFQPGAKAVFDTVRTRLDHPGNLYIKGVVSTLPPENAKKGDESKVTVRTVADGQVHKPLTLDVVQPEGLHAYAKAAEEVTRKQFLSGPGRIGFAIVHSKLIVIDPFTNPVVITGSHNFSTAASETNDENFVIVRGNRRLAEAYAAHILSVYQHYRWRALSWTKNAVKKPPQALLVDDSSWQDRLLKGAARREMDFWAGRPS
ncbi:MAG TPA: phospholipase D-like domain-containing protein [Myxococcota bacterium]|nr:phospholipase D-like domain-containing protein [Myxococcota bacterium]